MRPRHAGGKHGRRDMDAKKITAKTVRHIFGGGIVVRPDLVCLHCGEGGRIVKAKWPDRQRWQCHYCGREGREEKKT
jgi:hypothetical protein